MSKRNKLRALLSLSLAPVMLFFVGDVFAQVSDIIGVARRGTETFNAIQKTIGAFAAMIGVGIIVVGGMLIRKEGQEQGRGHGKNGIISIIVGSLFLALGSVTYIMVNTVTGAGDSAVEKLQHSGEDFQY